MNSSIIDTLSLLKKAPQMLIPDNNITFNVLRLYIYGYIEGLSYSAQKPLLKEMNQWYASLMNKGSSAPWPHLLEYLHPQKTDAELQLILIETMERYFIEMRPLGR